MKNLREIVNINENEHKGIKQVTDLHPHGKQSMDESCYISENDLRVCANNVIWIMNIHTAKVKENFKNTSTE